MARTTSFGARTTRRVGPSRPVSSSTSSSPFYQPGDFVLTSADARRRLRFTEPAVAHDALYFEALEVARCIAAGARESAIRPLAASITTLRVMDEIRQQCGITLGEA
jgi:hypothetical protein